MGPISVYDGTYRNIHATPGVTTLIRQVNGAVKPICPSVSFRSETDSPILPVLPSLHQER